MNQKPISQMTVKELQNYIRKLTSKSNNIIDRISKKKKINKSIEKEMQILERKGIIGKNGKAVLGFRGKTKDLLKQQARELEYFTQWKGTETQEIRDKTNYAKYKTFIKNNPEFSDYTFQDWRDLVEMFGSAEHFMSTFYYENLKETHREVTEKGIKVNMLEEMRNVIKESKGKGYSEEDVMDVLRSKIFK